MKEIVVSGIRSTGNLHLGNYYGALRNFVKMQEESKYNSYFFIACSCMFPQLWQRVALQIIPLSGNISWVLVFILPIKRTSALSEIGAL